MIVWIYQIIIISTEVILKMKEYSRKSIRLKNYDYSSNGGYFITICAQNKLPLFEQSEVNEMIVKWILKTEEKFEAISVDCFVVMKDHIHMIIIINESEKVNLIEVIDWFKTMTTNEYIRGVRSGAYKPFDKKLWQRSYYDHVIRNSADLEEKRNYILSNPGKEFERSTYIKI